MIAAAGRTVQLMKRHAIAPDGRSAFDDHKRVAGDFGQMRERLGGSDGRGDGDGVETGVVIFIRPDSDRIRYSCEPFFSGAARGFCAR